MDLDSLAWWLLVWAAACVIDDVRADVRRAP